LYLTVGIYKPKERRNALFLLSLQYQQQTYRNQQFLVSVLVKQDK
jgi:hypothetical protein